MNHRRFCTKTTSKKPNHPSLPKQTLVIVNVSLGVKLLFLSMESGGCFQQQLTQTSEFSFLRTAAALLLYPDLSLFSKVDKKTEHLANFRENAKMYTAYCLSALTPPPKQK